MYDLLKFLHLGAAIVWLGGMAFMLAALAPALQAQLQPPQRLPLLAAVLAPLALVIPVGVGATLACLAGLGALGAQAGGAPKLPATARVLFWGAAAMAITAGVGRVFGVSV